MAHHVHVFEAFEGIGEDVPLGFLVGVAALGKDTVGFLNFQAGSAAGLIEVAEIGDDIADLHTPGSIRIGQDRFQQHRLIGIAHVHLLNHFHEQLLAVAVVDELPAVLLGIGL